ncbi:hypothetical protein D3C81_737230 [compost metagenome]
MGIEEILWQRGLTPLLRFLQNLIIVELLNDGKFTHSSSDLSLHNNDLIFNLKKHNKTELRCFLTIEPENNYYYQILDIFKKTNETRCKTWINNYADPRKGYCEINFTIRPGTKGQTNSFMRLLYK